MRVHHIDLKMTKTKAGKKQWAWHAIAANGRRLGWTGEKHVRRAHCLDAMEAVTAAKARGIPVFEVEGKLRTLIAPKRQP